MTDINFITNNVKYNLHDFDITDDDGRDMTGTASYNGQEYKVNCSYNDDRPIALQLAEQCPFKAFVVGSNPTGCILLTQYESNVA